jgi:hypothetical protein
MRTAWTQAVTQAQQGQPSTRFDWSVLSSQSNRSAMISRSTDGVAVFLRECIDSLTEEFEKKMPGYNDSTFRLVSAHVETSLA